MRAAMVTSVIDAAALVAEVARGTNGATALFLGTVRSSNDGREVTGIEYSAYDEMAVTEMEAILEEAARKFDITEGAIEHRTGALSIGDASICVAVAAPHRAPAMNALRFIVDETKSRAPIWKLEHYADGTREWVGATKDAAT